MSKNRWRTASSTKSATHWPCWICDAWPAPRRLTSASYRRGPGRGSSLGRRDRRHLPACRHDPGTVEARREATDYLVRLEGGASPAGAATPADCISERGARQRERCCARASARSRRRRSRTTKPKRKAKLGSWRSSSGREAPGVLQADTLGYCGLEVDIAAPIGSLLALPRWRVCPRPCSCRRCSNPRARTWGRIRQIQAQIREEMAKQNIPGEISVADFVWRSDPEFEQQRKDVAAALGWRP